MAWPNAKMLPAEAGPMPSLDAESNLEECRLCDQVKHASI
jgi:hypothetical protein